MNGLIIRQMARDELVIAAGFTAAEGWMGEDVNAFEGFYKHDPAGCLLASLDGSPVGICIATCYGESGFIGELIVHATARGQGIGAALLDSGVSYLHKRGVKSIYLDGVVKAVSLYKRHGFRKLCRSLRFTGKISANLDPTVRPMHYQDLPKVYALDQQAFGADRRFFLTRRFELYPGSCRVLVEEGQLRGFIFSRHIGDWLAVAPWVVSETAREPVLLLEGLASDLGVTSIHIGTLESNCRAIALMNSLGFKERADSPWRMVLGQGENLGASWMCLAVGSPAKG